MDPRSNPWLPLSGEEVRREALADESSQLSAEAGLLNRLSVEGGLSNGLLVLLSLSESAVCCKGKYNIEVGS